MNCSPLRSTPPPPLQDLSDSSSGDPDSGVFPLTDSTVLVLADERLDLSQATRALQEDGFPIVRAASIPGLEELAFRPRFAIVDTSLPGALELLQRFNSPAWGLQVLALLGPDESEGPALAAGATLTVRQPAQGQAILLCLRRFRSQEELLRQTRPVAGEQSGAPALVLDSVLATIGHEIGNPLAAALASVECLRDTDSVRALSLEERSGAVDDTALALRRIQEVLNLVTSLVRGSPPVLERVSLWDVAERAVSALRADEARVELAGDETVRGWACTPLLEQALLNLVKSAIDATRGQERRLILVRVYRAANEARISVRDNGPGISSSLRPRIFEAHLRTKGQRSTNLGLVLVHHAVARMGGLVSLGSGNSGAVFRIRLRAA
jgi:signal transduction histidine kinase